MGSNVILAINGLIALTELSENLNAQMRAAATKIQQAQSEGRDLSDAELDEIEATRQAAVARWNTQLGTG